jgi:hypothetical protein
MQKKKIAKISADFRGFLAIWVAVTTEVATPQKE